MTLLLQPNFDHADELVLRAVKRRHGVGADFSTRSDGPGFRLDELVHDDGGSYSSGTDAKHFGKVARLLMRLVYELNVHSPHDLRPPDLNPKAVWVVDVMHPVTQDTRTAYLAVCANGPPVLLPLPDLPETLLNGAGTVADTRAALRAFTARMTDLVNLALPAARTLTGGLALSRDTCGPPVIEHPDVPKQDLVGTAEAAAILGVERPRIGRWKKSGVMPDTVVDLQAGPVWRKSDIERMIPYVESIRRKPRTPRNS